jgi:Skp family chaperone for outer membrane proteins
VLRQRHPVLDLLIRSERSLQIGAALAFAAVVGWGSFAHLAMSSGQQVTALTAERDAAVANYEKLQEAAGNLKEVEAKLGSARTEYSRVVQGWADTRGRLGAAQQELAALAKRLDQATERVSQTSSIRAEPSKPSARKP